MRHFLDELKLHLEEHGEISFEVQEKWRRSSEALPLALSLLLWGPFDLFLFVIWPSLAALIGPEVQGEGYFWGVHVAYWLFALPWIVRPVKKREVYNIYLNCIVDGKPIYYSIWEDKSKKKMVAQSQPLAQEIDRFSPLVVRNLVQAVEKRKEDINVLDSYLSDAAQKMQIDREVRQELAPERRRGVNNALVS